MLFRQRRLLLCIFGTQLSNFILHDINGADRTGFVPIGNSRLLSRTAELMRYSDVYHIVIVAESYAHMEHRVFIGIMCQTYGCRRFPAIVTDTGHNLIRFERIVLNGL